MERWRIPAPVSAAAATVALGCLAAVTWVQVGYWHDPVTIWERDLAVTRDNYWAEFHLGMFYKELNRPELAAPHFAEAARIHPDSYNIQFNRGMILIALGRYEDAIEPLAKAVRQKPKEIDLWYHLGLAHLHRGRPSEALPCFRKLLELRPDTPRPWPCWERPCRTMGGRGTPQRHFSRHWTTPRRKTSPSPCECACGG